jgi:hypothetical protein
MEENRDIEQDFDNSNDDDMESFCPKCEKPLIEKWSGVKCSECEYWECY